MSNDKTPPPHFHFVTGRLAETALREVVEELAAKLGLQYTIDVMPITVAALMTPKWLMRHLQIPAQATAVVLPGYLQESGHDLASQWGIDVIFGPRDLRQLPEFFGTKTDRADVMDRYDIAIIAEINHAPRLDANALVDRATALKNDGADFIDIGCDPASRWNEVGDAVARLVDLGFVVSIDTFDPWEAEAACRRGASLVLSVNASNRDAAGLGMRSGRDSRYTRR